MRLNLAAPTALPILPALKFEKQSGNVITLSVPVYCRRSRTSFDKNDANFELKDSVLERYQNGMLTSPSSLSFLLLFSADEFLARPGYLMRKSFFMSYTEKTVHMF